MAAPDELGKLDTVDWRRLQELADTYHEARRQGRAVDFEPYLPPRESPLRRLVLHELIVVDLELRWQQQQGVRLESYLERFPELGSAPQLPAKLIYEEFRVRHQHGDRPPLAGYEKRFPAQFEQVRGLAESGASLPTPSNAARPTVLAPPPQGADQTLAVGGGYRLLERIGSGSFGEVWRAEAPGGFPAAVKMIFGTVDQEEGQREQKALEMVRALRHRCLVQTYASWSSQDRLFIVMELADGCLRDRLEAYRKAGQPGVPQVELLAYFRDAAEGLDYLHGKGIQHRDVKPENILRVEGHAKVADFGLARIQEASRRLATATGVGTPLYMSPEVFTGKVSWNSDQYSLALAYCELRLGRRPLVGTNLMDIMREHLEKTPDLTGLPAAEQDVLLRALSKDPEARYPSCLAFVQALEQARAAPARPAPSPPPAPVPPAPAAAPPAPPAREPEPPGRSTVKPTGRRTDPALVRATGRNSVARMTGRRDQIPSWRAPRQQSPAAAWVLVVVLFLVVLLVALLLFRAERQRPPAGSGSLQLDPPPPLRVVAGTAAPLTLHVDRGGFRGPLALTFSGLPPHVFIPDATLAPDADRVDLTVAAAAQARPASTAVQVAAVGGDLRREVPLELTVLRLPAGCRPLLDGRLARDQALRPYYERIARRLADGTDVLFVLIPWGRAGDPDTFYTMVDKVSVGLFRKYLVETRAEPPRAWNAEADEDRPALQVGVGDAFRFAGWLGGKLPTVGQWDKAAGRFDRGGREGPFRGRWDEAAPPRVAVRQGDNGPRPVGWATDDVSVFGCRDMAGNGFEWTSSIGRTGLRLGPGDLHGNALLQWRGQGFRESRPLLFRDLDARDQSARRAALEGQHVGETDAQVGFRVVLELG